MIMIILGEIRGYAGTEGFAGEGLLRITGVGVAIAIRTGVTNCPASSLAIQ